MGNHNVTQFNLFRFISSRPTSHISLCIFTVCALSFDSSLIGIDKYFSKFYFVQCIRFICALLPHMCIQMKADKNMTNSKYFWAVRNENNKNLCDGDIIMREETTETSQYAMCAQPNTYLWAQHIRFHTRNRLSCHFYFYGPLTIVRSLRVWSHLFNCYYIMSYTIKIYMLNHWKMIIWIWTKKKSRVIASSSHYETFKSAERCEVHHHPSLGYRLCVAWLWASATIDNRKS